MVQNCKTSQGYIFHTLQYLTTKIFNFRTNFKMFFNAVAMSFPISKFFQNFVNRAVGLLRYTCHGLGVVSIFRLFVL